MASTLSSHSPLLSPEQVGELVLTPLGEESVAGRVATYVQTGASSYRLPIVTSTPSASWIEELSEIPVTDGAVEEVATDFKALKSLTLVSNELLDDSDGNAANVLGESMVRDLTIRLDSAYFGSRGGDTLQPEGLEDQANVTEIAAGAAWLNADVFNQAIFSAAGVGRELGAFVCNPADALNLANLKEGEGSQRGLLQPDPTQPSRRMVAGVPLETSPAVTEGTVWGLPAAATYVVVRTDGEVAVDSSAAFTRDGSFVRAKLRVDFLFPHIEAVQKIVLA